MQFSTERRSSVNIPLLDAITTSCVIFCLWLQDRRGGDSTQCVTVSQCHSVTSPLHPFRLTHISTKSASAGSLDSAKYFGLFSFLLCSLPLPCILQTQAELIEGAKNVISFRFVVIDEYLQRDRQIRSLMFGYSVVKVQPSAHRAHGMERPNISLRPTSEVEGALGPGVVGSLGAILLFCLCCPCHWWRSLCKVVTQVVLDGKEGRLCLLGCCRQLATGGGGRSQLRPSSNTSNTSALPYSCQHASCILHNSLFHILTSRHVKYAKQQNMLRVLRSHVEYDTLI